MNAPKGYFPSEFRSSFRYKTTGEFRAPRKDEYFLSGAEIVAYRAFNDQTTEYWIATVAGRLTTCPHCMGSGKVVKEL